MAERAPRGIDSSQEIAPSQLLRDTRTFGQKFSDFLKKPENLYVLFAAFAGLHFVYIFTFHIVMVTVLILTLYSGYNIQGLPVRMPKRTQAKDPNDLNPATKKPQLARGIAFFANDRKTQEEVWFNNDDLRTHALIFGSTGSGKTEALVSIAFNALVQGSGFIYVDGKGDNSLFAKVFSMVRSMGREDDLLLVNFMTGARDIIGAQEKRLSNTMNPFCTGSSSMLSQLVTSLMPSSGGGGGDGDMWKGRAISFVEALMKILVFMRDRGAILLDANTIRNYFNLERLEAIVADKMFIRDGQEPVSLEDVPPIVLEPLVNYVYNLPGYNKERKGKQVSQVLEQHGFITMQLTRVFSSLADAYGHIIRTNLAEVDFKDVVINRRILVVLLPALEKSPDELSNLGKIIIASLKAMMASGLGEDVEGDYRDVIERKPTNAPTPYMCILDEYGYYAVQGFAVVPAQARSLGFSAIFAGQDLPAFQKASKEEAASIGANTNIKICMKLEDPVETWDFFNKTAGEAYISKADSFQMQADGNISNSYRDAKSASFERRARIDLLDLKDQTEGQAHIFFKSKIIRVSMFYAAPKPVKQLRINQFLKVEPPSDGLLIAMKKRKESFKEQIEGSSITLQTDGSNDLIEFLSKALNNTEVADFIERAVLALISYHEKQEKMNEEPIEAEPEGVISIFAPFNLSATHLESLGIQDLEAFKKPFLMRALTKKNIKSIEILSANTEDNASNISKDITDDLFLNTEYPPKGIHSIEKTIFVNTIDSLINLLSKLQGNSINEATESSV